MDNTDIRNNETLFFNNQEHSFARNGQDSSLCALLFNFNQNGTVHKNQVGFRRIPSHRTEEERQEDLSRQLHNGMDDTDIRNSETLSFNNQEHSFARNDQDSSLCALLFNFKPNGTVHKNQVDIRRTLSHRTEEGRQEYLSGQLNNGMDDTDIRNRETLSFSDQVHSFARNGQDSSLCALLFNFNQNGTVDKNQVDIRRILSQRTEEGRQVTTPLIIAARNGHDAVVRVLLDKFDVDTEQTGVVEFDCKQIEGATALWCAAQAGHIEIVKSLVEKGANVNHFASNSTPVRSACISGYLDIVKCLVEHGADLTISNGFHTTNLMVASYHGHRDIVEYLLQEGVNPNDANHQKRTALHYAAEKGFLQIVKLLLHHGGLLSKDYQGLTPLMIAACCGHADVVEHLLQEGADPNLESQKNRTALHYAANEGFLQTVKLICYHGGLMNKDDQGMTPLMVAANSGHVDVVECLIGHYNCSTVNRIQALELLEAFYANLDNDGYDLDECFHYLWLAMHTRYSDPLNACPKTVKTAVEAYQFRMECQDMTELQAIRSDEEALQMEALMLRKRVLGESSSKILTPIFNRGVQCFKSGQYKMCLALLLRSLHLQPTNGSRVSNELTHIVDILSVMFLANFGVPSLKAEQVFLRLLSELETGSESSVSIRDKDKRRKLGECMDSNIHTALHLMMLMTKIRSTDEETERRKELVRSFNRLNLHLQSESNASPLHMVCDRTTPVGDYVENVVTFPSEVLLQLLLECGADVNVLDSDGKSPLNILLKQAESEDEFLVCHKMILQLLKAGITINTAQRYSLYAFYLPKRDIHCALPFEPE